MVHFVRIAALAFALIFTARARAQPIEAGTLKSLDVDKKTLVVVSEGKERRLTLSEDKTQVLGGQGDTLAKKLAGFKPGVEMFFRAASGEDGAVALGLKLRQPGERNPGQPGGGGGGQGGQPGQPGPAPAAGRRVSPEHASFKPLTELGIGKYHGFEGGLYPEGKNQRPAEHEALGLRLAKSVRPLDGQGRASDSGKIVLLSVGMSNTSQISEGFARELKSPEAAPGLHPALQFVNGAQGGMVAQAIQDPAQPSGQRYWDTIDQRLQQAGLTRAQVQVVWIKQADAAPSQGFPGYPRKLQKELKAIVLVIAERFPNVKLCYLSSRTYGGYATTQLNPEPVAYESGFAVKWLIEEQLKGDPALNADETKGPVKAPWLAWGPYLWANGAAKNPDGLFSVPDDFVADGTHHAPAGMRKMGLQLLKFFQSDSSAKPWFAKS